MLNSPTSISAAVLACRPPGGMLRRKLGNLRDCWRRHRSLGLLACRGRRSCRRARCRGCRGSRRRRRCTRRPSGHRCVADRARPGTLRGFLCCLLLLDALRGLVSRGLVHQRCSTRSRGPGSASGFVRSRRIPSTWSMPSPDCSRGSGAKYWLRPMCCTMGRRVPASSRTSGIVGPLDEDAFLEASSSSASFCCMPSTCFSKRSRRAAKRRTSRSSGSCTTSINELTACIQTANRKRKKKRLQRNTHVEGIGKSNLVGKRSLGPNLRSPKAGGIWHGKSSTKFCNADLDMSCVTPVHALHHSLTGMEHVQPYHVDATAHVCQKVRGKQTRNWTRNNLHTEKSGTAADPNRNVRDWGSSEPQTRLTVPPSSFVYLTLMPKVVIKCWSSFSSVAWPINPCCAAVSTNALPGISIAVAKLYDSKFQDLSGLAVGSKSRERSNC